MIQLFFWAKIDYIYVDNVVWGHFLAEEKLANGAAGVRGEMFNVTNRVRPTRALILMTHTNVLEPSRC